MSSESKFDKNKNSNIIPENSSLVSESPPYCNDNCAGTSCSITVSDLTAPTKTECNDIQKNCPIEQTHTDSEGSSNTSFSGNSNENPKNDNQTVSRSTECTVVVNKSKLSPSAIEALPRIRRELRDITCNPPPNCTSHVVSDDIFHWSATISGPAGSVYEGGNFVLDIRLPTMYPFRPPRIRFATRIYHCNIDSRGIICLDVLNEKWSPVLTISKVLLSVWLLLCECNSDDPLVIAIAEQYQTRRAEHDKTAREWVRKYAMAAVEPTDKSAAQKEQLEPSTTHDEPKSTEATDAVD